MLTIILTVILFVCAYLTLRKPKGFPPGPVSLPLIGALPFLQSDEPFHLMLTKLQRYYGTVFGYYLGRQPTVVIADHDLMKEALTMEELQYRPSLFFLKIRSGGKQLGIFFTDGPQWVEQRRFTLRHLRDFGFGKHSMEGLIHDEAMYLIDDIKQASAETGRFDPTLVFTVSAINLLWSIMAGVRYKHDNANLKLLLKLIYERQRSGNPTGGLMNIFPIVAKIAPKWSGYETENKTAKRLNNFIKASIDEHQRTYNPNESRDFIDVFLKEMKTQDGRETTFTDEQLTSLCNDLFIAGAESVSNTLAFTILHLVLKPEVQKKVHDELDQVVGKEKLPSLQDRPNLPYIEAVMAECMRMSNIAPLLPPHRAVKEVQLRGFTIPKDCQVFFNIHSVHMDKDHWGDPEVFRPERFLNEEGKFVKDEHLIPFGYGKRRCLGEPLAYAAYYLFFTIVLQKFSFKVPEGHPEPSIVPLAGFTVAPRPFVTEIKTRD